MFTLYSSDLIGNPSNCSYPHKILIRGGDDLKYAVSHDYVCAEYRGGYRSGENFLSADCLPADCDNDHSDDPKDWVTPEDITEAFPGVSFAVHYSRHHMKPKDGKSARPRFHILFPIDPVKDETTYSSLKKLVYSIFPYFDAKALDSARFFFGTANPEVDIYHERMNLTEFCRAEEFDAGLPRHFGVISQGERNSTLSRFAGRILKKYGDTDKAYQCFQEKARQCVPPLPDSELLSIWKSALRFYAKVSSEEGYIPPSEWAEAGTLKPSDYSDVGQAGVLAAEYGDRLRYSPSTDYLVYNGSFWEESVPKAQRAAQELTDRQLRQAQETMRKCADEMRAVGAMKLIGELGARKAAEEMDTNQKRCCQNYEAAKEYRNFVVKRRDSHCISASLKEARPMLEISPGDLDSDAFALNTPSATYDLRTAKSRPHSASDFITKQTAADPSDTGGDIWENALDTFFLGDKDLIRYVQEIAGLSAIGKVCLEALIIAYGEGRNGKSTFWNTISRALGTYSGNISADVLTVGCKRNVKPELAEARGKRLLIAAELEEGMRLSTSNVKQLCSTDEIFAEKKYKDPFSYVPTHTLVLYTNHLPRVGALDTGTWRRLIVIPFHAKIEGKADIKNYTDYLFEKAGGAVVKWIMEGARRVITDGYHIVKPAVVEEATLQYKENNDWLSRFLEDCCEVDPSFTEKSGSVYDEYRAYCAKTGTAARGTADFYTALESRGVKRKKTKTGNVLQGLRLKPDFLD